MASKFYKAYKFVVGGKKRPGIVGVKPKSGGVVDEFKARKLKQLGRTQRTLKSQDKQISTEIDKAKKRGASRKDLVKGRKFQRDSRRAQREGDKLKKDVLRIGKKDGGSLKPVDKKKNPGLAKLPTKVRNKMGYMKKGGRVKKFPDLTGDGKVTKADILKGRGVFKNGGKAKPSTGKGVDMLKQYMSPKETAKKAMKRLGSEQKKKFGGGKK